MTSFKIFFSSFIDRKLPEIILNTIFTISSIFRKKIAKFLKYYICDKNLTKKVEEYKEKTKNLEEKLNFRNDLIFKNNAYYKKSDGSGPYCSLCYDKDKDTPIILHKKGLDKNGYTCPNCKTKINTNSNLQTVQQQYLDNSDFNRWGV